MEYLDNLKLDDFINEENEYSSDEEEIIKELKNDDTLRALYNSFPDCMTEEKLKTCYKDSSK